jgi:hypothetical protein
MPYLAEVDGVKVTAAEAAGGEGVSATVVFSTGAQGGVAR